MTLKRACGALLIALALGPAGPASAADATVTQSGRAFSPGEVFVTEGATVHFNNEDEFIHQIYVDSALMKFDSAEQAPGETVDVKFGAAGIFEVHCHIHPKMKLIVHVK